MKQSIIKIALSTTLSAGLAVTGAAPVQLAMAQASSSISWNDSGDTLSVMVPIAEDNYSSAGTYVRDLLNGKVADPDNTGIAVVSVDDAQIGTWEFWDAGANQWYAILPDADRAYLLSSTDQIRFVPARDWNGTSTITYQLWDMSAGGYAAHSLADTASGSGVFSAQAGNAQITVMPENDAPRLTEPGSGGYYLGFDGNGDYVSIPDPGIYGNSFTVEGFLKVDGFKTWMRFFESSNGVSNYNVFVGFDQGKMNFTAYTTSGPANGYNNFTTTETFPLNRWVHTAFVYDASQKKGYIYWDGVLKAQSTVDLSAAAYNVSRANNWLGKSSWNVDGYYTGGMKDVRFWSKAKSQQEIIDEMKADLTGSEPGLVANYKLNDNGDGTVAISTPSGRNGNITNAAWTQNDGFMGVTTMNKNTSATRSFDAIDPDDGDDVIATAVSSNEALIPSANLVITGSGEDRTLTITPKANAYGTATITVTLDDGSASNSYSFNVIVNDTGATVVTGVTLDKDHLDLTEDGAGEALHATVEPGNAANTNVTWSSSDASVATVDPNGVVTPVGHGNAVITVTTADGGYTATATINVAGVPDAPTNVTAIPGDGEATINFTAPADSGGSPITEYTVIASPGGKTVTGSGSPLTITGLENGVEYTFTVIATNRAGDSAASAPSGSVTPAPPAPGAPLLLQPAAGDRQVSLSWRGVEGADGYKVFQSETPDVIDREVASVTGAVYDYTVTGLTNGTTYYFTIKATSFGQESAASLPVSATPISVPGAPTDVKAVAGNGQAVISFTPPAEQGGSPITGYEVTAMPGNITVTGTASPLTITGLTNGTNYTFTVKAINGVGNSGSSASSNAVTPTQPSSGGGSDSGSSNNSSKNSSGSSSSVVTAPQTPAVPSTPADSGTSVDVLVNGKAESAGTAKTGKRNDQTVTTIAIDPDKLEERLANEGENAVVTVRVSDAPDVVVGELNGQMVKNMAAKQAVLEIQTDRATYTLPADQIDMESISAQVGGSVALKDIKVQVEIAASTAAMAQVAEDAAAAGGFTLTVAPVDFTVKAVHGDKTVEVSKFNAYVKRLIALPDGVDPSKITTGVVVEPDGSVRHVPTKVVVTGGKYYAQINSLTNSTYSVVWHPLEFSDVAQHWAKNAVNDMGSRMVVDGVGGDLFNPNQDITRAEFAAIAVRGLGLEPVNAGQAFPDVPASAWYNVAVQTASAYGLINGFEDGTFRPDEKITREQAMAIIDKAMAITELKATLNGQGEKLLAYRDASAAAGWAKDSIEECLEAGIVTGRSGTELAPKSHITRAEVAAIVQRLLQKSDLI
ncbi:S-layer homology domain-containing protein [Paenibacillus macerans]|uniref:S-layer homology domain-containing protein n=1 Tax=Paenibacillus macerans TaxID=44252 RepID=UPI002040345B|nr:S-layer homology domain-containing protein [Paenibacillus macerans]MCM3702122.1 S-layer homology domain-containing protein [Paenibacillus macerans]